MPPRSCWRHIEVPRKRKGGQEKGSGVALRRLAGTVGTDQQHYAQPSVDFINGVCRCLSALGLRCPVFSAIQPSPARCTNGRTAVGTHILIAASPPVTWLSCTSPRNVTVERDSEIGYRCIARISTGWYLALPAATPSRYICPSTLQKKTR